MNTHIIILVLGYVFLVGMTVYNILRCRNLQDENFVLKAQARSLRRSLDNKNQTIEILKANSEEAKKKPVKTAKKTKRK